jgi:hypothetical protein
MKTINNLSKQIALNEAEWDEQFFSIKNDPTHQLKMSVSSSKNYSEMCFTTREAMYGFAKSLLFEALYGTSGSIDVGAAGVGIHAGGACADDGH